VDDRDENLRREALAQAKGGFVHNHHLRQVEYQESYNQLFEQDHYVSQQAGATQCQD
jgi:hypothetical protein